MIFSFTFMFSFWSFLVCSLFLQSAFAEQPAIVISEVLWMGSDLSTADEWIELANIGSDSIDISGWKVTTRNGSGEEVDMLVFPAGTVMTSGDFMIIGNYPAENSRLLEEPYIMTTAVLLPNTKLLLRVYDANGNLIDEVDDGVGVPFAGRNEESKASMERVNLSGPGNVQENWQTAETSRGFDEASPMFGTPGFGREEAISSASSSISNSFSSVNSSSSSQQISSLSSFATSSLSSISSVVSSFSSSVISLSSSFSSSCISPDPQILIQSGEPRMEGKVTINLQAVTKEGSLSSASCSWDYDDGYYSTSCNPRSHTFKEIGEYIVTLTLIDHCGTTVIRTLDIEVLETQKAESSSSRRSIGFSSSYHSASSLSSSLENLSIDHSVDIDEGPCIPSTFSDIRIIRYLPNPKGDDRQEESITIKNIGTATADLCGWKLDDAEKGSGAFSLDRYTLESGKEKTFFSKETKIALNNTGDDVRLFSPKGLFQSITFAKTAEGVEYEVISEERSVVPFIRVIDGDTIEVLFSGEKHSVRMLGINAPEMKKRNGSENTDGIYAKDFLIALIENKKIELVFDTNKYDIYGRLLAYIHADGEDLGRKLIEEGLVDVFTDYPFARMEEYLALVQIKKDSKEVKDQNDSGEKKNSQKNESSSVSHTKIPKSNTVVIQSHIKSSFVASSSSSYPLSPITYSLKKSPFRSRYRNRLSENISVDIPVNQLEGVMSFQEKQKNNTEEIPLEWEVSFLPLIFIVGFDSLWRVIKWM